MGIIDVYCVAEVHEKGGTLLTNVGLDVRVREVGLVDEVGDGDSNGVSGPQLETRVIFVDVEYHRGTE